MLDGALFTALTYRRRRLCSHLGKKKKKCVWLVPFPPDANVTDALSCREPPKRLSVHATGAVPTPSDAAAASGRSDQKEAPRRASRRFPGPYRGALLRVSPTCVFPASEICFGLIPLSSILTKSNFCPFGRLNTCLQTLIKQLLQR